MDVAARLATENDLPELGRLYGLLEAEMSELSYLWAVADGLQEPIGGAFRAMIDDPDTVVLIASIDEVPFGFMVGRVEQLPDGSSLGSIRLVFTEFDARSVGIGSAMREQMIETFTARSIDRIDAHVLPGHRLAKNFFEAGGFSARHIVMHRKP